MEQAMDTNAASPSRLRMVDAVDERQRIIDHYGLKIPANRAGMLCAGYCNDGSNGLVPREVLIRTPERQRYFWLVQAGRRMQDPNWWESHSAGWPLEIIEERLRRIYSLDAALYANARRSGEDQDFCRRIERDAAATAAALAGHGIERGTLVMAFDEAGNAVDVPLILLIEDVVGNPGNAIVRIAPAELQPMMVDLQRNLNEALVSPSRQDGIDYRVRRLTLAADGVVVVHCPPYEMPIVFQVDPAAPAPAKTSDPAPTA